MTNDDLIYENYKRIAYLRERRLFKPIKQMIVDSGYDKVAFTATRPLDMQDLESMGVSCSYYGIDPEYYLDSKYTVCDVIFDNLTLEGLIVHVNAQKTYPIGKVYTGEFIIIGHSAHNVGDCTSLTSCDIIVEQNNITDVKIKLDLNIDNKDYHIVWGSNE
jgi:hypothetical protein